MISMPGPVVAEGLNRLIISIVSPDRCRKVFHNSDQFTSPAFLAQMDRLSDDIDHLVFDLSFMRGFPEMKEALKRTPQEVVDCFIARVFIAMAGLETETGSYQCKDRPDFRPAMRLLLIRDPLIRTGGGPTH